jgi:hypothetical protein
VPGRVQSQAESRSTENSLIPRLLKRAPFGWRAGRLIRLRADCPLISPSSDLAGEAPVAEWDDDQAAARVGGIRLGMARRAERHQVVEIEVRAPLGALDDVVELGEPSAVLGPTPFT